MAKEVNRVPRGIRNCNPLNIRKSSATWQGLVEKSKDAEFCEFHTLEYGWRAAIINIAVTYRKRGWNTIRKIITHWAPENENDTKTYIKFVASYSGIDENKELDDIRRNREEYRRVLIGMAKFEQGFRWINAVCIDRLDKALSKAEFKSL